MTGTGRPQPTVALTPAQQRAEERARERAERAEFDALFDRLRAHQPDYRCFCGSLDDLRRVVADLDRRAARRQTRTGSAASGPAADPTFRSDARVGDPQLAARLAVARAAQQAGQDEAVVHADRYAQLSHWHSRDHKDRDGDGDSAQGAAAIARSEDGDG